MVDVVDDSGLMLAHLEGSTSKFLDKETQVLVVVDIQGEPELVLVMAVAVMVVAGIQLVVMAVVVMVVAGIQQLVVMAVAVMVVVGIQQLVVVVVVMMAQGTGWGTRHTLCSWLFGLWILVLLQWN